MLPEPRENGFSAENHTQDFLQKEQPGGTFCHRLDPFRLSIGKLPSDNGNNGCECGKEARNPDAINHPLRPIWANAPILLGKFVHLFAMKPL